MAGIVDRYECAVVLEPGTGTSSILQPMFNAWAETVGIHLFPGTAYLCANRTIELPKNPISLAPYQHLHAAGFRRGQQGYSPRLYEVRLAGSVQAWVYRWSDDDAGFGFVGDLPSCNGERILEVISPVSIRQTFGGTESFSVEFL